MHGHHYQTVIVVLSLTTGWVVVAGAGNRTPESDLAAPGAPLYEYTLTESVKSLMSKQEQAELGAEGRPPSPGPDYFWCENCKTYHKGQNPASAQQPAVAQTPVAASAPLGPPDAATVARPPSPGPDYFWCENCKTYHKIQTPAAAQQPGGGDYYYCEKCKTYHHRQPVAQQPAADLNLILGGVSNSLIQAPLPLPDDADR